MAYHTLFYMDLYLSHDEASFQPPAFSRPNSHFLGNLPWPPHEAVSPGHPFEQPVLSDYAAACAKKAVDTIQGETCETLQQPSGFPWYPMSRGEHHLCNIRHIQHHAGQLAAYLRRHAGIGVDWIGKLPQ